MRPVLAVIFFLQPRVEENLELAAPAVVVIVIMVPLGQVKGRPLAHLEI